MPPRLLRVPIRSVKLPRPSANIASQQICPICSISQLPRRPRSKRAQTLQNRPRTRHRSSEASVGAINPNPQNTAQEARRNLRDALHDLQKHAASYVNISRLQLAQRGLEQNPGDETIRIAILGNPDGGASLKKAKALLRLMLADPLKPEEEWERILTKDQPGSKPILIRVGHDGIEESGQAGRLLQELNVLSPTLNGHKLEILVLEADPLLGDQGADRFLVPTMEIPTSSTGRYTPVTTPVHKAIVVADGIQGAATLLRYSIDRDRDVIESAADLSISAENSHPDLSFQLINLASGTEALALFRKSLDNALAYETGWFASGLPGVIQWIVAGTAPTEGEMKWPLRKLISSVLLEANSNIDKDQTILLGKLLASRVSATQLDSLQAGLSEWAERAHTELRDQLDIAFAGHRWHKLGWWKLFWRVDDVSMITTDILNQRFLPGAEREVIYLAGRIAESGIFKSEQPGTQGGHWAYTAIPQELPEGLPPPPRIGDLIDPASKDHLPIKIVEQSWPVHIPAHRALLSDTTIPALQALAQKLVLQTLSTSSLTSALAGLMYVSTLSTTVYEAGAVAALGVVWSLRRMQNKWETARTFWEGEVREEGRKAVREVEAVIGNVIVEAKNKPVELGAETAAEISKARDAVKRAEDALAASN